MAVAVPFREPDDVAIVVVTQEEAAIGRKTPLGRVGRPEDIADVIVFLVDGVNAGIFENMLDAGELPAFRRYFGSRTSFLR